MEDFISIQLHLLSMSSERNFKNLEQQTHNMIVKRKLQETEVITEGELQRAHVCLR
jgi:hypothetical protein